MSALTLPRGWRIATPHEVRALEWGQMVAVFDTEDGSVNTGVVMSSQLNELIPAPVEIHFRGGHVVGCWGIPISGVDQYRVLKRVLHDDAGLITLQSA